jgi:hypothetical protein
MKTWLDLENRFRSLAPSLKFIRLDAQWGAAGEFWRIAGPSEHAVEREFELLCGVAGQFLERVYSAKVPEQAALLQIPDHKTRWYTLLKQSSPFCDSLYGEQRNEDGTSAGFIYSATLHSVAEHCANLCLALQTEHPILERSNKWRWFHDNYGKAIVVGAVIALIGAAIKLAFG